MPPKPEVRDMNTSCDGLIQFTDASTNVNFYTSEVKNLKN